MFSNEVDQFLSSFINHEHHLNRTTSGDFKLARVRNLLYAAGNPQDSLRIIHIAGSKGKGSTAALTANILKCAGYRVGLYTSPHMTSLQERIRVVDQKGSSSSEELFGDVISDEKLSFFVEHLKPFVNELDQSELGSITFYEFLTVLAFCYFKDQNTDFVILETGLGGRLDATNCCRSLIAVITPISLEHTALLGDTLPAIAYEKGGIIKEGTQTAVLASQGADVMDVLLERCAEQKVTPFPVGDKIRSRVIGQDKSGQKFKLQSEHYELMQAQSPLLGAHQLNNIVTACGIMEALSGLHFDISQNAVYEGIKTVFWPCRFEIVNEVPPVIVDGAHNVSSIRYALDTFAQVFGSKELTLVLGVSDDKDIQGILNEVKRVRRIIVTAADHPRSHVFVMDELKEAFLDEEVHVTKNVKEAMNLARKITAIDDGILITGSLFIAGEARKLWHN